MRSPLHNFIDSLLKLADVDVPQNLQSVTRRFSGLSVDFLSQTGTEPFHLSVTDTTIVTSSGLTTHPSVVTVKLTPQVLLGIMRGVETPGEAFLMGRFRAYGTTDQLYQLHDFFIALAGLTLVSPNLRRLVAEFEQSQPQSPTTP